MPVDTWTDERVSTLTRMWEEGHSATRIAVALDLSRGAIIGKIHRLGLPDPAAKLPVIADHSYRERTAIDWKARREKARIIEKAYRERVKAKRELEARKILAAQGTSRHSAAYRKHLPPMPEMSKAQMRAMLAQALENTAAL